MPTRYATMMMRSSTGIALERTPRRPAGRPSRRDDTGIQGNRRTATLARQRCALCVIHVTLRGPIGRGIRPGVLYGIRAMLLRGSVPGLVRPAAGAGPGSPGPQGRRLDLPALL